MVIKEDNSLLDCLPILILYPINSCNCRCRMCGAWEQDTTTSMHLKDVISIASEAKKLKLQQVVFSGGEPLLHPDIDLMCEAFHQIGVKVTLLTNGLMLPKFAERLVTSCHEIIVSLDGPREIHNTIRNVPNAYERLEKGILSLRQQSDDCTIFARCTVQQRNSIYLRATVDAAHNLRLDKISFLAVTDEPETFYRDSMKVEPEKLIPDIYDLPQLEKELNLLSLQYSDDFKLGFIVESPQKLNRRLLQYFSAMHGLNNFPTVKCNAPFVSAVVESNGDMLPCFFHSPFGNLFRDGGLASVLNSKAAIKWRLLFNVKEHHKCRRCVCSLNLLTNNPGSPKHENFH